MRELIERVLARAGRFDRRSFFGRAIRMPLRLMPSDLTVPVVTGPLKGMRWTIGAGVHGCWLGVYEGQKQRVFVQRLRTGDVVFDIGAHAGFHTLLAARLVGSPGRVVAFEPDHENIAFLTRHVQLNNLTNVTIVPAAVSDTAGAGRFLRSNDRYQGHLHTNGDVEVAVVQLDRLWIDQQIPRPDLIKIDVEGDEIKVIRGARRLLGQCRPVLLVAAHSLALYRETCAELEMLGYLLADLDRDRVEFELIGV